MNDKTITQPHHKRRHSILLFVLLLILASMLVWHLFIPVTIMAALGVIHFGVLGASLVAIVVATLLIFLLSGIGFFVVAILTFVGVLVGIILFPFLFPFMMVALIFMAIISFFR